jgi:Cyclic nucleotide-binding domain
MARAKPRRSRREGRDTCECGNIVTAPSGSSYSPSGVINEWWCTACGRQWEDTVLYIQKGRIKVLVVSEQGKEAVVGILEPGQFFGEGCLNGHPLRISTATAMEECLITSIAKDAMFRSFRASQSFPSYL